MTTAWLLLMVEKSLEGTMLNSCKQLPQLSPCSISLIDAASSPMCKITWLHETGSLMCEGKIENFSDIALLAF